MILYLCGSEGESPQGPRENGKKSISDSGRRALQRKHGLGAWTLSGAVTDRARRHRAEIARVRDHFMKSGKARFVAHEDAAKIPPLQVAINAFSGIPSLGELGLLKGGRAAAITGSSEARRWTAKSPTNSKSSAGISTKITASITW